MYVIFQKVKMTELPQCSSWVDRNVCQLPDSPAANNPEDLQLSDIGDSTSHHRAKLTEFCRNCGNPTALLYTPQRSPLLVTDFAKEMMKCYQLDISSDSQDIHPPFICKSCASLIRRNYKCLIDKRKFKRTLSIPNFGPHTAECEICKYELRRSPRKRMKTTESCVSSKLSKTGPVVKSEQTPSLKTPSPTYQLNTQKDKSFTEPQQNVQSRNIHQSKILRAPFTEPIPQHPSTEEGSSRLATTTVARKSLNFGKSDITSIPVDRCIEESLAERLKCSVCLGVPIEPTITTCGHIHCKSCIVHWLSFSNTCTYCRTVVDQESDVVSLKGFHDSVYKVLHVACQYSGNGCNEKPVISHILDHERICAYVIARNISQDKQNKHHRGPGYTKQSLRDSNKQYVKRKRLKTLIHTMNEFCERHHESRRDVLFFLLRNEMEDEGNKKGAESIDTLWHSGDMTVTFSPDECLAIRVDTLQSKGQYKNMYDILKSKGDTTLRSPDTVSRKESKYMPGSVPFSITQADSQESIMYKESENVAPINILEKLYTWHS